MIRPLKNLIHTLSEIRTELAAIRYGLQLLVDAKYGTHIDLLEEGSRQVALDDYQAQLAKHKPYGPGDLIQTSHQATLTREILEEMGDETEEMIQEVEKDNPRTAEYLRREWERAKVEATNRGGF